MVATLDSMIDRFRRRFGWLAVLVSGVRTLGWWCLGWGILLVALRAGLGVSGSVWWWGLIGVPPVLAVALVTGWRSRPPHRVVRALLDRHNRQGGLVMAAGEVDLETWEDRVGELALPRLRGRPPWGLLAAGAVLVVAAAWVPTVPAELQGARALAIGEEIDELARRVRTLEEENLLDEEQATGFENALQQLAEEASGKDPASTWATLDHLQEMTDRAADEVAETALTEGEQLAAAAAMAKFLAAADALAGGSPDGGSPDETRLAEAVAELSAMTARTAAESRLLDRSAVAQMAAAAGSSPAEMLDALGHGKADLGARLDRLHAGGALDLADLLRAREALESGSQSLARFLDENDLEATGAFLPSASVRPGRGGVDRGRGDAPMLWQEASTSEGARFREQILDAGSMAQLGKHRLMSLSVADPTIPQAERLAPGADGVDPSLVAGGGTAVTQRLLPRHRGAVQRYFDRSDSTRQPSTEDP